MTMKKSIPITIGFLLLMLSSGFGQQTPLKTYRVGIFSALYLDSVFSNTEYNYGKKFPKFTQQGLDFVQGAEIALDSLPLPNGNIIATVFDSKASVNNIPSLITNHKLDSLDLIIGSVKDIDFIDLAKFAKQKNIPFISATYPNDGGIVAEILVVQFSNAKVDDALEIAGRLDLGGCDLPEAGEGLVVKSKAPV